MIKDGQMMEAHFLFCDDHEDLLPRSAFDAYVAVKRAVPAGSAESAMVKIAREVTECLDRLDSFLLQVRRVATYGDVLNWEMPDRKEPIKSMVPESGVVIRGDVVCTDFESLLFHGRAALDRLTLFLTRHYGENSDRFSRLHKSLGKNAYRCGRAQKVLAWLASCQGIKGILANEGDKSLRSLVAHRGSIQSESRSNFAAWRMKDGRYLAFDCKTPHPVLKTTRKLAQEVPFFVLNALALYSGPQGVALTYDACIPVWKDMTTVFSQFVTQGEGLMLFAPRLIRDGVRARWNKLRIDVLEHAFDLSGGPPVDVAPTRESAT